MTQQSFHPILVSYARISVFAGSMGIPTGGSKELIKIPWEYGHGTWERFHQSPMGIVKAYG